MSKIKISGMMHCIGLAKMGMMSIPDHPAVAGKIMSALGAQGINVQFIVQCIDVQGNDCVVFCIAQEHVEAAHHILEDLRQEMGMGQIVQRSNVALLSIFGPDFRERPGIAGRMFSALGERGINILAISTSISTLSCMIDADCLDKAVAAMHDTFELPRGRTP
jgi:aspartate kinase